MRRLSLGIVPAAGCMRWGACSRVQHVRQAGHQAFFELILTYLGLMDGTSDIERNFSTLVRLGNERRLTPKLLRDTRWVALEVPTKIDALVHRVPHPVLVKGAFVEAMWRPCKLLTRAMRVFAECFGRRRLASRSRVVQPVSVRRQQSRRAKVVLPVRRVPRQLGPKALTKRWSSRARALVKAEGALAPESTSGPPNMVMTV